MTDIRFGVRCQGDRQGLHRVLERCAKSSQSCLMGSVEVMSGDVPLIDDDLGRTLQVVADLFREERKRPNEERNAQREIEKKKMKCNVT